LRRLALVLAGIGLVAAAAASAWCGSGAVAEPAAQPRGDLTLAEARMFDEFPLVYAGERVGELPLVAILHRDDTARYVSFVYGDCRSSSYDAGCAPPAEIQVWPTAARSLGAYDSATPEAPVPTPERTSIRGSPAAFFDDGARLEIFLPRVTVVVFSDARERVLAIAGSLRCLARSPPISAQARTLDC
jgi:hypothetical protein